VLLSFAELKESFSPSALFSSSHLCGYKAKLHFEVSIKSREAVQIAMHAKPAMSSRYEKSFAQA
jgi:hypothetical protein